MEEVFFLLNFSFLKEFIFIFLSLAAGFDLNSNPSRHDALVKAANTGLPVSTEKITLVQETGSQVFFLFHLLFPSLIFNLS